MAEVTLGYADDGEAVGLELDRLIGSHACIVANTGGGKSGLIRRLLETTHGHVQHMVLDIEDEFYSLRERFSYVIAGGDGGDVPATVEGAAALARAALEHNFSLIVQLNDLGENAPKFVAGFLQGLMAAPRELWRPVLIPIDEAQRFVPSSGQGTPATSAVRDLLYRGRKRGFTAVVASLRISEIDPGVRGMCNNWLLGRVGQALDRNLMADQLGFTAKEGREKLRAIEPRHFYGFGSAIAAEPVLFRVDDVDTTPVRPGQAKVPTPPAPEALREILAGLATPAPASDPSIPADAAEAYRVGTAAGEMLVERDRRIAELEEELQKACAVVMIERHKVQRFASTVAAAIATLQRAPLPDAGELQEPATDETPAEPARAARMTSAPFKTGAKGRATGNGSDPAVRGRKALDALARIYPAAVTEAQWAALAGYAKTGGTWGTYKGQLRGAGLVEQEGELWRATRAGLDAAGVDGGELPELGPDLIRFWGEKIPGVRRMAYVLLKRWPHFTTREGLAADLGMAIAGGTFGTYLGRLRANGLIEEQGKRVRLNHELMGQS